MKRSVLLATVLTAMVPVAVTPVLAQVSQETGREMKSGAAAQDAATSSADHCAEVLGAAQTGNAVSSTGTLQAGGDDDEIEADDGSLTISPAVAERCEQETNQTAAAASPKAEARETAAPSAAPKSGSTKATILEGKDEATKAKTEAKLGERKQLPKTGGGDPMLLVFCIGALLVAGGLLARNKNH